MQFLRNSLKQLQISIHSPGHTLKNDRWLLRAAARHLSGTKDTNSDIIMARVLGLVRKYDKIDGNKVTETSHFQKDLGLDSLDKVELVMAFEQEFSVEIPDEKADKLACCADVVNYIISEAKTDDGESHGP